MKTRILMIIVMIIVMGLFAVTPSLAYGLEIPMDADEVLEYFDLIVLGTITDVKSSESLPTELSIEIEEFVKKPQSFDDQTVTALGCDPNKSYRGTSCPNFETGQRGLFLISQTDDDNGDENILSSVSKVSEAKCTAEEFLANYRGLVSNFYLVQNGQSDFFFTEMPLEIHYTITSRDMMEKDYSLELSAYTSNFAFSDSLNGTLDECRGFVDVATSFVPTKMGTYGFNAEHNDGGESFYGLAIIDYGLSPLKQFQAGIHAQDTWCKEGLFLILKNDDTKPRFDNHPACVLKDTAAKLIDRNWGYAPPNSHIFDELDDD